MTDETREDGFEEFFRRAAEGYHRPPETPREEIWERIRAARRPVAPLRRVRRPWLAWGAALAAVLALGIGLGRVSVRHEAERREPGAGPTVAAGPAPAESTSPANPANPTAVGPDSGTPAAVGLAETGPAPTPAPPPAANRPTSPAGRRDPYRMASEQMLSQAEALLVEYRTGRRSPSDDAALAGWARQVLASTRLLLDSPAADDLRTRRLLEDLELVLAQIVQGGGDDASDHRWIDETLDHSDLIPRLRTAVPAGSGPRGT